MSFTYSVLRYVGATQKKMLKGRAQARGPRASPSTCRITPTCVEHRKDELKTQAFPLLFPPCVSNFSLTHLEILFRLSH